MSSSKSKSGGSYAIVLRTDPGRHKWHYGNDVEELFSQVRHIFPIQESFENRFEQALSVPEQYISIVPLAADWMEDFLEIIIGETKAVRKYLKQTREEIPWQTNSIRI